MIDLNKILKEHESDINEVSAWAEEQYQNQFATHFKKVNELHDKLKSKDNPLTDEELEWILTSLPLELIDVSEKLSNVKTSQEVIKVSIKTKETELADSFMDDEGMSAFKAKELAANETIEDKLLLSMYDIIYERVSRQVTFAKELIMSCKKIWDARRNSEQPVPSIHDSDLPEYSEPTKTYVK